jgi:hypothetical protein
MLAFSAPLRPAKGRGLDLVSDATRPLEAGMRLPVLTTMLIVTAAPSLVGAHEWYTGLRSPTGVDCCGESDCHPVSYRLNPHTGRQEINANDKWHPVEHDKVLPFPSPDGRVHACWDNPFGGKPNFHCIILPGMTDAEGMTVLLFQA